MRTYEYIDHTADLAIRAWGESLEQLLTNAAQGVLDAIADTESIEPANGHPIIVEADSLEDLLVGWLSELIYQHEVQEFLFRNVVIHECTSRYIRATAYGEAVDTDKHILYTEIKNVTYHQLCVSQVGDAWDAQVILDL